MSATTELPGPGPDAADSDLRLVLPGRSVPAGEGLAWIGRGWKLFARSPVMWIISLVILFIAAIAFAFVPLIGPVIFQVLNPVIVAGFMVACRVIERGGDFELEHLFAGFKRRFGSLAIVGLLFMAMGLVLMLVFGVFFGFSMAGAFMTGDSEQALEAVAASSMSLLLGALVCFALFIPVVMAYWFAPALVVMHGMAPVAALKASFLGCLRNVVPFLLYGLVMTVLAVVAAIPLGLGFLVWVPVTIASTYAGYRAIFTEEPGEPAQPPVMVG